MTSPLQIVGHAIVSRDGMIADAEGRMPPALRSDADWRRFQAALDAAALVVLGRIGHAAHPNPDRRRLVATHGVAALAPDPNDAHALLWNPAGIDFDAVLARLGVASGSIAVTGGTQVFDLFLPRFTGFDLAIAEAIELPGGRPCFSAGAPAEVLAAAGLEPAPAETLEPGVSLQQWQRGG